MSVTTKDARQAQDILKKAGRIVCICHRNPDGDAVGALLGIGLMLEVSYSNIPLIFYCVDAIPDTFRFLSGALRVRDNCEFKDNDVLIFLDSAEPKLTGLDVSHPQLFDGTYAVINIDHHPSNTRYGICNIVIPDAASSCEIVVGLADVLGWKITNDVATSLLTGVYTDTGGLLHSNTTTTVYRTVARLLRAGARQQEIISRVFRTANISTLKLWGRVLEKISITEEGGAISAITEGDFRATGADYSALTGAIDYVNAIPGMRFSLILSERGGVVKGSLRTLREDVDVAAMAGKFKGGGHRKAAGFSIPGTLKPEVRWKVVEKSSQPSTAPLDPVPPLHS